MQGERLGEKKKKEKQKTSSRVAESEGPQAVRAATQIVLKGLTKGIDTKDAIAVVVLVRLQPERQRTNLSAPAPQRERDGEGKQREK